MHHSGALAPPSGEIDVSPFASLARTARSEQRKRQSAGRQSMQGCSRRSSHGRPPPLGAPDVNAIGQRLPVDEQKKQRSLLKNNVEKNGVADVKENRQRQHEPSRSGSENHDQESKIKDDRH